MRESHVEAKFREAVRRLGGITSKIVPVEKGIPDRLVLLPGGRIQLVELKADDGRLSPAQKLWHRRASERGTDVEVVIGSTGVDRWERENRQCEHRPTPPPGSTDSSGT